jgi:hypothetical protein
MSTPPSSSLRSKIDLRDPIPKAPDQILIMGALTTRERAGLNYNAVVCTICLIDAPDAFEETTIIRYVVLFDRPTNV